MSEATLVSSFLTKLFYFKGSSRFSSPGAQIKGFEFSLGPETHRNITGPT